MSEREELETELRARMLPTAWGKVSYVDQRSVYFAEGWQAARRTVSGQGAQPVAWRYFDGEGNYQYLEDAPSESSIYHASIYGRKFEPLCLVAPIPATEPSHTEKDAARYRFLRSRLKSHNILDGVQFETWFENEVHDLDTAIDAASEPPHEQT